MIYNEIYDVIVVGGGYVGIEVVFAFVWMGLKILFLMYNVDILG